MTITATRPTRTTPARYRITPTTTPPPPPPGPRLTVTVTGLVVSVTHHRPVKGRAATTATIVLRTLDGPTTLHIGPSLHPFTTVHVGELVTAVGPQNTTTGAMHADTITRPVTP